MTKRSHRKASKPPPARRPRNRSAEPSSPPPPSLLYKVVELSTVDEASLERCLNEWVRRGWALDGVQFAMRESSKRPAMAFVLFTREGPPMVADSGVEPAAATESQQGPNPARAYQRLAELAGLAGEELGK